MSDYDDSRDSTPQYCSPDDIDEKVIGMDELSKSTKEATGMELKREKGKDAKQYCGYVTLYFTGYGAYQKHLTPSQVEREFAEAGMSVEWLCWVKTACPASNLGDVYDKWHGLVVFSEVCKVSSVKKFIRLLGKDVKLEDHSLKVTGPAVGSDGVAGRRPTSEEVESLRGKIVDRNRHLVVGKIPEGLFGIPKRKPEDEAGGAEKKFKANIDT